MSDWMPAKTVDRVAAVTIVAALLTACGLGIARRSLQGSARSGQFSNRRL